MENYLKRLKNKEYKFLDFGCSRGDSMIYAKKEFGLTPGLGLDLSRNKVREALARELDAMKYDILDLPEEALVDFTIMISFPRARS